MYLKRQQDASLYFVGDLVITEDCDDLSYMIIKFNEHYDWLTINMRIHNTVSGSCK